jgi:23S rRNA (guanine2445-N2)-methyltransferase / 23S rRNA (guanine2069-N7)-methyltransferase
MSYKFLITCPKGLENLLQTEIENFGGEDIRQTVGGVYAQGSLKDYYTVLMSSRLCNRVLIELFDLNLENVQTLRKSSEHFSWLNHFDETKTFSINFRGRGDLIKNSMFGAQVIKDGLCDYFRHHTGMRPSVFKKQPDVRIIAYLNRGVVRVYIDPYGLSCHQRGARIAQGDAPIKENIAAAMLRHADWDSRACENYALIDPFCGSGTLLIEAMQMFYKRAPGLDRDKNSLMHWKQHDSSLWEKITLDALATYKKALEKVPPLVIGLDKNKKVIAEARKNITAAGLDTQISISCRDIKNISKPKHLKQGLVICNPPYGERLDEVEALIPTYQALGRGLKNHFDGWSLAVITSEERLSKAIGLKSYKRYQLKNGSLDCQLALFKLSKDNNFNPSALDKFRPETKMLFNRLKKNQARLSPWLKVQGISSFRLYDADLPEFNAVVDVYKDYVHVQEYAPPKSVDEQKALSRLQMMVAALAQFGFERNKIVLKQRVRQRGSQQYQKLNQDGGRLIGKDGSVQCYLNLYDYLDTGLFLDHRRLRQSFANSKNKQFLNLFCYTGVASLHAAISQNITTNVDLSKTYLNWAKDNFRLNHLTINKHQFIHADVMEWIEESNLEYDVIFCDPPSFSNSKRMKNTFDISREHPRLIDGCMRRLTLRGELYFSTNLKRFKLDEQILEKFEVINVTEDYRSKDFLNARLHPQTFLITHRNPSKAS